METQGSTALVVKTMAADYRCGGKSVRITVAPPDRLVACSLDRADETPTPPRE